MSRQPGVLATADGELFRGTAVGAQGVTTGEAVFNTSMTGYQEIITDPSYAGQVVVMTSPHIGNYGVTSDDDQSAQPFLNGFVMKTMSRRSSSWRAEGGLDEYLSERNVISLADIDTRRLTRHLRERGAMPIAMGSDVDESELIELAASAPEMVGQNLAQVVSTSEPYTTPAIGVRRGSIVAVDLGIKRDIVTSLAGRGYEVSVFPHDTPAETILDHGPDGVFLSNGPGDPEPLIPTVEAVRGVLGQVPLFGICLGHQVLGLAVGAETYKLPFGHHGGNHPVRRLDDGGVEITSQNHGFAVDLWALTDREAPKRQGLVGADMLPTVVESGFGQIRPTHQNLNDGTLEGMRLVESDAFSVQYHPEAAPGPHDAAPLFDEFVNLIEEGS